MTRWFPPATASLPACRVLRLVEFYTCFIRTGRFCHQFPVRDNTDAAAHIARLTPPDPFGHPGLYLPAAPDGGLDVCSGDYMLPSSRCTDGLIYYRTAYTVIRATRYRRWDGGPAQPSHRTYRAPRAAATTVLPRITPPARLPRALRGCSYPAKLCWTTVGYSSAFAPTLPDSPLGMALLNTDSGSAFLLGCAARVCPAVRVRRGPAVPRLPRCLDY